jgi:hypothetical protein
MSKNDKKTAMVQKGSAGGFYFLGFIGAAVHFVSSVDGFWITIWALLKAAVWPAFLINKVFELLRI